MNDYELKNKNFKIVGVLFPEMGIWWKWKNASINQFSSIQSLKRYRTNS